ncbi:MAG: hypothetical protein E7K04_02245 [Helicobacter sp.]|nr:hypothetical protein [Helicobacter sp.]
MFGKIDAAQPDWNDRQVLDLRKDQIRSGQLSLLNSSSEISFHWTLNKIYKNKDELKSTGLVGVLKYDGFNHHFVLFNEKNRDTFKLKIGSVNDYLVIILKSFDENNASFFIAGHGEVRLSL